MNDKSISQFFTSYVYLSSKYGIILFVFFRIAMTYKKSDRLSLSVTIGNSFPKVLDILPSTFGVGQYFPNFGETISNSDLNTGHYLCNVCSETYYIKHNLQTFRRSTEIPISQVP